MSLTSAAPDDVRGFFAFYHWPPSETGHSRLADGQKQSECQQHPHLHTRRRTFPLECLYHGLNCHGCPSVCARVAWRADVRRRYNTLTRLCEICKQPIPAE